ncbi:unnamed protein product [Prorocentrum cordatum]|uniref:Uncharacterized protein n=1 Tax=Prorocentrum cordatum TaxID=2364126 RepID=A0ABN9TU40_9DINO|nr:unnamed protein product [Polarella glacialis]
MAVPAVAGAAFVAAGATSPEASAQLVEHLRKTLTCAQEVSAAAAAAGAAVALAAEAASAADAAALEELVAALSQEELAAALSQEVEATVMWVQRLLESARFTGSEEALAPGASLLSVVQPRLRHQRDEALGRSRALFRDMKEAEGEADEHAAVFRRWAMEAVLAKRAQ